MIKFQTPKLSFALLLCGVLSGAFIRSTDASPYLAATNLSQPAVVLVAANAPFDSIVVQPAGIPDGKTGDDLMQHFHALRQIFSITRVLSILLILIITFFGVRAVTLVLNRLAKRERRGGTFLKRIMPVVEYGLWLFALMIIIAGFFRDSVLAFVLLLAFAFVTLIIASQQFIRDVVAGLVIAFERPFQIGNFVRLGDSRGEVRKIGLRSFELLAEDGTIIVVPNSEVMRQSVSNANRRNPEMHVATEVSFPSCLPIEHAKQVVFEAAAASPYTASGKPIAVRLKDARDNSHGKLLVTAYVFDARYEGVLQSSIIEASRRAFAQAQTK